IYSLESVFLSFTTFSLLLSCPPKFPFFPYTTLFRSESCCQCTSLPLPCPWESPLLSDWLRAQGHPAQQMASARNSRQTLPTAMGFFWASWMAGKEERCSQPLAAGIPTRIALLSAPVT